jgi:uncharacterized membrane protein YeaQ/YmgE (transglycosylase-associated protein family)
LRLVGISNLTRRLDVFCVFIVSALALNLSFVAGLYWLRSVRSFYYIYRGQGENLMQLATFVAVVASAIAAWFAKDIAKFILHFWGPVEAEIKIETSDGQHIELSRSDLKNPKGVDALIHRLRTEHQLKIDKSASALLETEAADRQNRRKLLIGLITIVFFIVVLASAAVAYLPSRGIISWIILGLIAGFIGNKIVDRQGQGFWLDIALGIVGALVGGFLFDAFGATGVTGLNIWSVIVAVVGSIVVLLIYNAATGRFRV